jgi:hypothetical protein
MSESAIRAASRLLLSILPLLIATGASADVLLPTTNFTCGLFAPPAYSSALLQSCSGTATQESAPPSLGIQGVDLGTDPSGVTWNVDGSNSETLFDSLVMTSSGLVGGSGSFVGVMPLQYDFTIAPGTVSCVSSNPCTVSVSWSLSLEVTGPAVVGGEVAAPLAFGSGTGEFTGTSALPSSFSPFVTPAPLGVNAGADLTVYASLNLSATLPADGTASFGVTVPEGSSFDFRSADNQSSPEPASMGLLAAGLLLFGYRRLTSRP